MPLPPVVRCAAVLAGVGALVSACGLPDVFSAPGLRRVVLTYSGPQVISVGETTAVEVDVEVDGAPLAERLLQVTSADTTVIGVLASGDSMVGRSTGRAALTIRLMSSILTDSIPTLVHEVRVNASPPNTTRVRP